MERELLKREIPYAAQKERQPDIILVCSSTLVHTLKRILDCGLWIVVSVMNYELYEMIKPVRVFRVVRG